jgi:hypothetical protein
MIAYLVNQTGYPTKKPHSMTFHRSIRPKLPHFGLSNCQTNFLDSPNVLLNRLNDKRLTFVEAR